MHATGKNPMQESDGNTYTLKLDTFTVLSQQ